MKPKSLSASTLKGDKIRNPNGDKLGHLEEIVIDLDGGRVHYAVLASGGFLGLGGKFFAVPWDLIAVDTDSKEIVVDISRELLENAPGFDKDNWPDVSDRSWVGDVYRYYGREPYWEDPPDRDEDEDDIASIEDQPEQDAGVVEDDGRHVEKEPERDAGVG